MGFSSIGKGVLQFMLGLYGVSPANMQCCSVGMGCPPVCVGCSPVCIAT